MLNTFWTFFTHSTFFDIFLENFKVFILNFECHWPEYSVSYSWYPKLTTELDVPLEVRIHRWRKNNLEYKKKTEINKKRNTKTEKFVIRKFDQPALKIYGMIEQFSKFFFLSFHLSRERVPVYFSPFLGSKSGFQVQKHRFHKC